MIKKVFLSLAAILAAGAAQAHTGEGVQGGLISGFTHPLFGWDHVVAMVAVGLWGVREDVEAWSLTSSAPSRARFPLWSFRLCRFPEGNIPVVNGTRICALFVGTFVRVWCPRPSVVVPLEPHGPCRRPDCCVRCSFEQCSRSNEVGVAVETTRTGERLSMPACSVPFATFWTGLGRPRLRDCFYVDSVLFTD